MMSWAIQNVDFLASTVSHVSSIATLSIATHSIGGDAITTHSIATHSIAALVPHDGHIVLAQQFQQDILGDLTKAFGKFVKTGQLWAMLIGFVLGFVFKSITSYG
jgi:hypothetical protein